MIPSCFKCNVLMKKGMALRNTIFGYPDFPGDTGREAGCTVSDTGPPEMILCWKCPQCGKSITRGEPASMPQDQNQLISPTP